MINQSHPEVEEREASRTDTAIALPTDQRLVPAKKKHAGFHRCNETLRERLMEMVEKKQITLGELGAQCGYSKAALSQYLDKSGCKYQTSNSGLEKALLEWERDRQLILDTGVETIDCEIAQQMTRAFEDIRTGKHAGVIIGYPGVGKTRGCNLYCESHALAFYGKANSWNRSESDAAACLFEAADVKRSSGTVKHDLRELTKLMNGTARLGIFDDAHKWEPRALQLFYDFRDATGMPFALVGNEKLEGKLCDDGQRMRRTGLVYRLKVKNPMEMIAHHIKTFIPDVGDEFKAVAELLENVVVAKRTKAVEGMPSRIETRPGIYGSVQQRLARAVRLQRGADDRSWVELIRMAHKQLLHNYELV